LATIILVTIPETQHVAGSHSCGRW